MFENAANQLQPYDIGTNKAFNLGLGGVLTSSGDTNLITATYTSASSLTN